jgi:hypothetical protein
MTLSIMTLSIMTLSIMTLSIMTLSIMTLNTECRSIVSFFLSVANKPTMPSVFMLNVVAPSG